MKKCALRSKREKRYFCLSPENFAPFLTLESMRLLAGVVDQSACMEPKLYRRQLQQCYHCDHLEFSYIWGDNHVCSWAFEARVVKSVLFFHWLFSPLSTLAMTSRTLGLESSRNTHPFIFWLRFSGFLAKPFAETLRKDIAHMSRPSRTFRYPFCVCATKTLGGVANRKKGVRIIISIIIRTRKISKEILSVPDSGPVDTAQQI